MRRDGVNELDAAAQHRTNSRIRTSSESSRWVAVVLLASFSALAPIPVVAAETFDIGLATSGSRIDAIAVAASTGSAPTVVLVGGLHGEDASAAAVRAAVTTYERRGRRALNLLAVPLANPDGAALAFPPSGVAYREHAESHVLWRWLGAQAPDLVLVAGDDSALIEALNTQKVADMGRIPARHWSGSISDVAELNGSLGISEAHSELQRRRARSPQQLAEE